MPRKDFRTVRDKFANDSGLPFGRLLTREHVLQSLEAESHEYRQRVFCPLVTLWAWLSQCLSQDKSLNEAVTRILAAPRRNGPAGLLCIVRQLQQCPRQVPVASHGSAGERDRPQRPRLRR